MRPRSLAFAALTLLPTLLSAAWAQPAFLVKDIEKAPSSESPLQPARFGRDSVEVDGVLYFLSNDGIHGTELWRSDGTTAGTRLVIDLCPGLCSSDIYYLTAFQHKVYWTYGVLWESDGTPQGTAPAKVTVAVAPLGEVGGKLLLSGYSGSQGALWATDGTVAGTVHIRDFPRSPGNSYSGNPTLVGQVGGVLFFTIYQTTGETLWATDGTPAGTVPLSTGAPGVDFGHAVAAGGRLFFQAESPPTSAAWVSDGTPAGTQPLADIAFYSGLMPLGSKVFFVRGSFDTGWELWKSDGTLTGTIFVKTFPARSNMPRAMAAAGNRLFLDVEPDLWVSDGTPAGTLLVRQFSGQSGFKSFAFGDRLAFFADDGVHGLQPWMSDGTVAGTYLVAEIDPGPAIRSGLGLLGSRWLFDARDSRGWFLWASDGTPGNLSRIAPLDVQTSSFPIPMTDLGGTLLFSATDTVSGRELWRTNGRAAGTFQVKDIVPGFSNSYPYPLAQVGNQFFFGALDGSTPYPYESLWATDGTAAGTRRVPAAFPLEIRSSQVAKIGKWLYLSGLSPQKNGLFKTDGTDAGTVLLHGFDAGSEEPQQLTTIGGRLFFLVLNSGASETSLWTSDGTVAGTQPVGPGFASSDISLWGGLKSRVLFTFADATGTELWTSDGTAADTHMITTIAGNFWFAAIAAERAFFVIDGTELWSTDGTAHGTGRVADVGQVVSLSPNRSLTAVGGRVFFTADDGIHGAELWVSDGTAAGTRMVADILHGSGSSLPDNLTAVDGLLLFTADDGVHGVEPWVSDGTRRGTRMLQDIAPGPLSSSPSGFLVSGRYVYFSATDAIHGFELWAVPREALGVNP